MIEQLVNTIPDSILEASGKKILLDALKESSPSYSVRLQPEKMKNALELIPIPWCSYGYYLENKPRFSMDPLWHAGAYYVQEAGSMFLAEIIKALNLNTASPIVLDLCASPGGKTTLLQSCLPQSAIIISNEVMPKRLGSLIENGTKWGKSNLIVTQSQPSEFAKSGELFDLILVDAPCSGEGLIRRTDEAVAQWSQQLIDECAWRQKDILKNAIDSLLPGGYLVYSTCTYNTKENEDNIAWMSDEFGMEDPDFNVTSFDGIVITETKGIQAWRFFPGLTQSEGFFITVLQKPADHRPNKKLKEKKISGTKHPMPELFSFGKDMMLVEEKEQLKLYPKNLATLIHDIQKRFNVVKSGTTAGVVTHRKFIPDDHLHFSSEISIAKEFITEVDYITAVNYLAKNTVGPFHDKKQFGFLSFNGMPIGLVNHLGNRINNCYPANWRILKTEWDEKFSIIDLLKK